jgi:hypothetical protein
MKIYAAGIRPYLAKHIPDGHPILLSFAYNLTEMFEHYRGKSSSIIIDSGAFTVWKSGKVLDFESYANWCKQNYDHCDWFIAPDIIGGSTKENIDNLEKFIKTVPIDKVMPVFHEGDDFDLLDYYFEKGFNRIGLGATKSRGKKDLCIWLEDIFKKYPHGKYHGLAMTQPRLMQHYAGFFESADSTTWLAFAKYGIEANKYLLMNRSLDFYRKLGILVLDDLLNEKEKLKETQEQMVRVVKKQVSIFDLLEAEDG